MELIDRSDLVRCHSGSYNLLNAQLNQSILTALHDREKFVMFPVGNQLAKYTILLLIAKGYDDLSSAPADDETTYIKFSIE